jgi:hypothetical protein
MWAGIFRMEKLKNGCLFIAVFKMTAVYNA